MNFLARCCDSFGILTFLLSLASTFSKVYLISILTRFSLRITLRRLTVVVSLVFLFLIFFRLMALVLVAFFDFFLLFFKV